MAQKQINDESKLATDIGAFYADPLGFVMYAWDWEHERSLQVVRLPEEYQLIYGCEFGPDQWAIDMLNDIGAAVKKEHSKTSGQGTALRFGVASGHGIGKSVFLAWITNWIMSTRPHAKGVVSANTSAQLETKTWAEIARWASLAINAHWWEISTGRGSMRMRSLQHPNSWTVTAQTCREENSESFSGLHAASSTPFIIMDEASAIPDKIWDVSEGSLTDGEPMFFAYGNPTRNSGRFWDIFNGAQRNRWHRYQIDSRTVQVANKDQIGQWVSDYGLDSDFVKVRVRGIFPSMSSRQFISVKDVDAATNRVVTAEQCAFAPVVITCDPAWEGDDALVIAKRQGLSFEILRVMPKNDNDIEVAQIIAQLEDEYSADAVFVDAGYGTGIVSAGRTLHRNWLLVWFGGASSTPGCLNKRAEMWMRTRDWLKSGGSIPDDKELRMDLIGPQTKPRLDGIIQLESKADMKKRGLASPNKADALGLSFAFEVQPRSVLPSRGNTSTQVLNYNPLAQIERLAAEPGYDPLEKARGCM